MGNTRVARHYSIPTVPDTHCVAGVVFGIADAAGCTPNLQRIQAALNLDNYQPPEMLPDTPEDREKVGIILDERTWEEALLTGGVRVKVDFIRASRIPEWEFIDIVQREVANPKCHVVIGFDYGHLHNLPDRTALGHVALVSSVDNSGAGSIQIEDPGPRRKGLQTHSSDDLYAAARARNAGLWLIREMASISR